MKLGYALGSGFALAFFGQRPDEGQGPTLLSQSSARQSLASHPAAKPHIRRQSLTSGGKASASTFAALASAFGVQLKTPLDESKATWTT